MTISIIRHFYSLTSGIRSFFLMSSQGVFTHFIQVIFIAVKFNLKWIVSETARHISLTWYKPNKDHILPKLCLTLHVKHMGSTGYQARWLASEMAVFYWTVLLLLKGKLKQYGQLVLITVSKDFWKTRIQRSSCSESSFCFLSQDLILDLFIFHLWQRWKLHPLSNNIKSYSTSIKKQVSDIHVCTESIKLCIQIHFLDQFAGINNDFDSESFCIRLNNITLHCAEVNRIKWYYIESYRIISY